jgi:hypothetical protein
LNAWLGGFESIVNKMNGANFDWFLHTMLFIHTQRVIQKQREKEERENVEKEEEEEEEEEEEGDEVDMEPDSDEDDM